MTLVYYIIRAYDVTSAMVNNQYSLSVPCVSVWCRVPLARVLSACIVFLLHFFNKLVLA